MIIDINYFRKEAMAFRSIMCDISKSLEEVEDAFEGFSFVYLNTTWKDDKEKDAIITLFQATMYEHNTRWLHRILAREYT